MNRLPLQAMLMKAAFACLVITLAPPAAQSAATAAPAPAPDTLVSPSTEEPPAPLLDDAALQELVAPVALYPDDLLSVVLPASTYPLQVVQAARFLEALEKDPSLKPDEAWDDAIIALLNYPEVVQMMDDDLDWTWRLGEAVLNQEEAVLAAVTAFREQAVAAGNLKSDDKQIVEVKDEVVEIRPANPQEIYVPYYEPARVIVYQPAPVYYYYPRPRPVYYYPYPVDYYYPYGYFWGLTSAFWIGWSSHHVHVYHHYHYRHPYYGHHYYPQHHHYYRSYRPDRYAYAHHYDYSQFGDHDRYRDGYRTDGRHGDGRRYDGRRDDGRRYDGPRYDDSPFHWRPERRHGARPQPRMDSPRIRHRDGTRRQGQQGEGRRWLVENRDASPLGPVDGNPFARRQPSAVDTEQPTRRARTSADVRRERAFASDSTRSRGNFMGRSRPQTRETVSADDTRRSSPNQPAISWRDRTTRQSLAGDRPARHRAQAPTPRSNVVAQPPARQQRAPSAGAQQRNSNDRRWIASGSTVDGRHARTAPAPDRDTNITHGRSAPTDVVRSPTHVRPERPAVASVPPNSVTRSRPTERIAPPRANAPRQVMGFAPPARVERSRMDRGRSEPRMQSPPRMAQPSVSAPAPRVERQARAEQREHRQSAPEVPRRAQPERAPREHQANRGEQGRSRGFGGRQHF